jgi:hypothetical protein
VNTSDQLTHPFVSSQKGKKITLSTLLPNWAELQRYMDTTYIPVVFSHMVPVNFLTENAVACFLNLEASCFVGKALYSSIFQNKQLDKYYAKLLFYEVCNDT